jgi:hypothetical protein
VTPPAKKTAAPAKSLSEMLAKEKETEKPTPVDEPIRQEDDKPFPTDTPTPTEVDSPRLSRDLDTQLSNLPEDEGFDQTHSLTNTPPDSTAGKLSVVKEDNGQISVVPTWKENPDHNLGKLHPDMQKLPDPVHSATTSKQVFVTQYAGPAERDDKGFPQRSVEETYPDGEDSNEFAPENENDDKNIKRDDNE